MSVVSVNEVSPGRRLADDFDEDSGAREYIVIMNAVSDGPAVAKTANDGSTAIPSLGDPHPDNAGINVNRVEPYFTDNRMIWMVRVDYSGNPDITTSNPTNEPWKIAWGFENELVIIPKTKTDTTALGAWGVAAGDPIDNSVGDFFVDPPQENKARLVCTLTKNFSTFDVVEAEAYMNTMNDASIAIAGYTAPKWSAKVIEYSGTKTKRGVTDYWIVRYRVMVDKETFIREIANAGWQRLVGGKKEKVINVGDGSFADEVQKLDAAGAQTDVAYYWSFGTLLEKDYSALSLPTTM